jgi:raffinose/stachyose/melibiose transport system substrate-binding protein
MKKILILVLALVMMCSIGAQAEKIKLTAIASVDAGSAGAEVFHTIMDGFAKAHPDIELEIEEVAHDAFHTKLQAMAVAKQIPDLIYLWPGKRTGYVTDAGLIKDLRPWLKGKEDQFLDWALLPQGPNGEIWELPSRITSTHVIYINDRLLKELGLMYPKTLDELVEQSKKIREAGYTPLAMGNQAGWPMQSCLMSTLTERAGGMDWFNKAIKGDGASYADSEFVNALNVIKTLADEKVFIAGISQIERTQAYEQFVQEKAVYFLEGDWRIRDFIKSLTDEQKAYISLNTFPEIPNQKGMTGSQSAVAGTGFGMNANLEGAKADAAWELIWYYAGPAGSEIQITKGGVVPAYKMEPPDGVDPLLKKLIPFLAEHPMSYVLDDRMDAEGMMNVLNPGLQEVTMGSKTPEQLAKEYEEWVAANDSNRK